MAATPDPAAVEVSTETPQSVDLPSPEQTQETSESTVKNEKKGSAGSTSKTDIKNDNGREKGDKRERGDSKKERLEFSKRESRSLDAQSKKYEHKKHETAKTRRGSLVKSKSEEYRHDNGLRRQGSREGDAQPRRSSNAKRLVRSKAVDKDIYDITSQGNEVPPRLKLKAESSDYPSPRIVRQHSGTRSEPALSRDSSMDEQSHRPIDSTGTDVLQFIIKALQTQKDRKHLLDFERDVLEFMESGDEEKNFPPMNSYQRMLLHRVAVLFGLEHNVDDTKSYVILNKTQHMRVPDQKFQDYIKDDPVPTTILKRAEHSADYSSMGRPFDKDMNKQNKSFEERKENYEELRNRLFSDKEAQEITAIQRPNRLLVGRRQDSGTSDESMRSWIEDRPWSSVESSGSERQHPAHIIKASSFAGVTNRNSFNRKDSSSSWTSSSSSSNRGSLSKLARVDSSEQRTGSPQYRPSTQFPVYNQQFMTQPGHQLTYQPVQSMPQVSSWQHNNMTGHTQQQMPANSSILTSGNISSPTILYSAPSIESVPAGSILYNPHTGSPYQNQDGSPLVYHPGMTSQVPTNQPITNQNLQQVQMSMINPGQIQQPIPATPVNINQLQNQQHLNQQMTSAGQHIPSQVYGNQPVLLHQLPQQTSGEFPDVTVQLQAMNINRQPSNESDPGQQQQTQQQQQQQQSVIHQSQMLGQVVRHPGVIPGYQIQGANTPGGGQQQAPQVLFCPPNQNQPQVTQTQITYQVPTQFVQPQQQQQQGVTMQQLNQAAIQQHQQQQHPHQPTPPVIYQTQPQMIGQQQQQPILTQGSYQHIPMSNIHQQQQQQQQQILYSQPVYDPQQVSHQQGFGSNLQIVYQTPQNTAQQLQAQTLHSVHQDVHRSASPASQILTSPMVGQGQPPMAYVHLHQQHRPPSPHSGSQYSSHQGSSKSPSPQQAMMQYQQRITPGCGEVRSPKPGSIYMEHSTLSPSMSPAQSPSPSRADSLEKGVGGRRRLSATGEGTSQDDPSKDDLNVLYVVGIPVEATVSEAEAMLHEVANLGAQITWTKRNSGGLPGIMDRNDKATEYTIRALLPTAEHAQRVHRSISSTNYQLLLHKTDSFMNPAL
ncbi:uncharacterized protein [Antedon mediterranea]|uniref:uncharacterized protein isoform X2 n=1 Tax=Antedon mediterranea TaxID=105859 RepID=UPI003AF55FF5